MTGLESNGYYINNEIWIRLTSYSGNLYFTLRIDNGQGGIMVQRIYADVSGSARVNISPIIKALFNENSTVQQFTITRIISGNNNSLSITKKFIRGGIRTTETNASATASTWLTPSEKFPVFSGFPIQFYYLTNDYNRQEFLQQDVPESLLDLRNTRGCNGMYIRFLNQLGGYSYWFFESHSFIESSSNLGGFISDNQVNDLGNEEETTIKCFSKFPKEYKGLAKDLIVSQDISYYHSGNFIRIRNSKNSIETDNNKRAYGVTLKFDIDYRFNPSLLWSN